MATERYRDFYGSRASIKTNDLTGEAKLRITTAGGTLVAAQVYRSHRPQSRPWGSGATDGSASRATVNSIFLYEIAGRRYNIGGLLTKK